MILEKHLIHTPVFHLTHVDNLVNILKKGKLLAKNQVKTQQRISIASEDVQSRREKRLVSRPPGGVLHDYAPFYFAPRAPMLYCNYRKSIPNACNQADIIYLVTTAQEIAAKESVVFFDRHAVLNYAECFNQLKDLDKIDWRIFFEQPLLGGYSKYWRDRNDDDHPHWNSRREIRQAEFLVHESLDFSCIQTIAVQNLEIRPRVIDALKKADYTQNVEIKPEWYF